MPAAQKDAILRELEGLKDKMEELYSESFREKSVAESCDATRGEVWHPHMDVWGDGEKWLIVLDVPGVSMDKLSVEVRENVLSVCGERLPPSLADGSEGFRMERPAGRFCREVELPDNVESDKIDAELKEGVLTIRIPKRSTRPLGAQRILVHRS